MTAARHLTGQELQLIKDMALGNTIYMGRNILQFDYRKDEITSEEIRGPECGISSLGPHKVMAAFIENPLTKLKMLQAPRGSLKSTLLEAWLIKEVIRNPNLRVLYGSETYSKALMFIGSIKERFEQNHILKGLFGDLEGPAGKWSAEKFTIKGRTRTMREHTFQAFGPDKAVTGGHYDIIILDDLVSWINIATITSMEKVERAFRMVMPLLDPGGTLIVVGTRYHEEDLYGIIENEMGEKFDTLILECGFEVEEDENKQPYLVGSPKFVHLTKDFLEGKLVTMGMKDWISQYINRITTGASQHFRRDMFHTATWRPWMEDLAGYIVTDTATSQQEEGCYSVIGLIGLDSFRFMYLCDLRVGHFKPADFCEELFDVLEQWNNKIVVRKILFENGALQDVFLPLIKSMGRERGISISQKVHGLKRGSGEPGKVRRIQRLSGPLQHGKLIVLDTVAPTFYDLGKNKVLFQMDAHVGPNGEKLPGGELVNEFIQFPLTKKKDIPDAMADIEAVDNLGRYICKGTDMARAKRRAQMNHRAGHMMPIPMMINGRKQLVNVLPTESGPGTNERWERLADKIPG